MARGNLLSVHLTTKAGVTPRALTLHNAVIAGWTARDVAAMEKHIKELEKLGVARPLSTPMYYRVAAARITSADAIEATGGDSSGEVEFVIWKIDGALWIGAGSDHTDRKVETYNISVSKQMCDKPISKVLWPWDEVADHWDSLILRSYVINGTERTVYQEGTVAAIRPPEDLIAGYAKGGGALTDGSVMFGGTLAAKGGIRPAERFEFELIDPQLGRTSSHGYDVERLPLL
jgi:hypothetical protein